MLIIGNQSGFMDHLGHMIGIVLLGISLGIIAPILHGWLESMLAFWLIIAVLFFPLFLATHAIGDFVSRLTRRDDESPGNNQKK